MPEGPEARSGYGFGEKISLDLETGEERVVGGQDKDGSSGVWSVRPPTRTPPATTTRRSRP